MKKNFMRLLVALLVVAIVYFSGIGFYAEKFSANTSYGNVDISNLTLDEAQEKIQADYNASEFTLTEDGQEVGQFVLGDLEPTYKDSKELEASYVSQNPNTWVNDFFQSHEFEANMDDQIEIEEDNIINTLESLGIHNDERVQSIDASIQYSDDEGYHIVEGETGNQIDPQLLKSAIVDGLEKDNFNIALEDLYQEPEITSDSDVITDFIDTIDEITSIEITYEISGDEVTIPGELIEEWIYFNESNNVVIDGEAIRPYLEELNEKYSTYNTYRQFESTLQGTVEVPPGILGWGIDIDTEIQNIINDIHAGKDVNRQPAFSSSGGVPGAEDEIGDTYVEIDLTYQYMYLYVDGQIIVETPIVSGQPGAETVPGANAVNEKLYDTKLRGYNPFYKVEYATPVDYWIRFDNNDQGIHDASWQGSFGGDVWSYAGSLGCINTPYSAVATIYEYVDYGTPVIVFY